MARHTHSPVNGNLIPTNQLNEKNCMVGNCYNRELGRFELQNRIGTSIGRSLHVKKSVTSGTIARD